MTLKLREIIKKTFEDSSDAIDVHAFARLDLLPETHVYAHPRNAPMLSMAVLHLGRLCEVVEAGEKVCEALDKGERIFHTVRHLKAAIKRLEDGK